MGLSLAATEEVIVGGPLVAGVTVGGPLVAGVTVGGPLVAGVIVGDPLFVFSAKPDLGFATGGWTLGWGWVAGRGLGTGWAIDWG